MCETGAVGRGPIGGGRCHFGVPGVILVLTAGGAAAARVGAL